MDNTDKKYIPAIVGEEASVPSQNEEARKSGMIPGPRIVAGITSREVWEWFHVAHYASARDRTFRVSLISQTERKPRYIEADLNP